MKPLLAKILITLKMQAGTYLYTMHNAHTYAYAYCVCITYIKIGVLSQKWVIQKNILNILSFGHYLEEIQYCNTSA